MTKHLCNRLFVVLLWIILSLGIYQCSVQDTDTEQQPEQKTEEPVQTVPLMMDDKIRVLIKTGSYERVYHDKIVVKGQKGLYIETKQNLQELSPDEEFTITFNEWKQGSVTIYPKADGRIELSNVRRSEAVSYRGCMTCYGTSQGLVLVNELPVEEYLYGVVPSEMPSSYPLEALKAQAVSARTYAFYQKQSYAYPEWRAHVDDSTTYQVYQNISEQDVVNQAVDETKGLVMTYNDDLIESFYYSTSWGYSSGYDTWREGESKEYLKVKKLSPLDVMTNQVNSIKPYVSMDFQKEIDCISQEYIEKEEPWFRWNYEKNIAAPSLLQRIWNLYESNPDKIQIESESKSPEQLIKEKNIKNISVDRRSDSGMVTRLAVETEHFQIIISSQHCIRTALATPGDILIKQDGSAYSMGELLPSAFFYLESISEEGWLSKVIIHGGGMGHGVGMSQNGAKCLAQSGYTYGGILRYFYQDICIEELSD